MKKALIAILLVLTVALSLTLAACDNPVAKIEIKQGTINRTYDLNDKIDYNKGVLIVTYENGDTKEVKFTDDGVKYTPLNTDSEGSKTLIVTYAGKTAEYPIEVREGGVVTDVTVRMFDFPEGYKNYLSRSADNEGQEDAFKHAGAIYKVGSVNKFQFSPVAEYLDDNLVSHEVGSNVLTTMKLFHKSDVAADYTALTADETATYVTKDGNYYKFNSVANGEYFKMEVTLDTENYKVAPTLKATTLSVEFQVVDAYNVYDMFGLSVYDNLNVNHWAVQKDRTLRWDDKKLSEYTDVTQIVLHNDIEINPDNLPQDYFWTESTVLSLQKDNDPFYTRGYSEAKTFFDSCNFPAGSKLEGSLVDGVGDGATYRLRNGDKEDYYINTIQKALYMTSQCSLSGNYMAIETVAAQNSDRQLVSYVTNEKNAGNNPKSHWAILGTIKTNYDTALNLAMENVDITGNMDRVEETDGVGAGLLGIITGTDRLDITNVNMRTCFTHIIVLSNSEYVSTESEFGNSAINLTDSNLTDAYSNMIYLFRTTVNITNSTLKDAGGPLMIVVDGNRTKAGYDSQSDYNKRKCSVNVDDKSVLIADAAGTESWYSIYSAGPLLNYLKTVDEGLQKQCKVTIQHPNEKDDKIMMLNIIAVLCPEPGDIMTSAKNADERIWIKGDFIRNGTETYSMEDPVYWGTTPGVAGIGGGLKAQDTMIFKCGNANAFVTSLSPVQLATLSATGPSADFSAWTNHSDLMCVYLNVNTLLGTQYAPYFGVILGSVQSVA